VRFTLESLEKSLDDVSDPAFAVDDGGRIVAWNGAAEAALGHPRVDIRGMACHEIIRGKDALAKRICKKNCLVFQNLRNGKPARRFQMQVRVRAGHHVEAECATLHLRGSNSELVIIHLLRLWPGSAQHSVPWWHNIGAQPSAESKPPLTSREGEVLGLLVTGKGTKEMAATLGISPATVRTHVENILHKLGARSRLEAVVIAVRNDLI
jgi:PAS domain S-box-containing protein